jgi:hypothetical protein
MTLNCTENWATFEKFSRRQMRVGSREDGRENGAAIAGWLSNHRSSMRQKAGITRKLGAQNLRRKINDLRQSPANEALDN